MSRAFTHWHRLTSLKTSATDRAEELFARAYARLPSAILIEWHRYAFRMARLKVILLRILGRQMELAFKGWRRVVKEEAEERVMAEGLLAQVAGRPMFEQRAGAALARWAAWPLSLAFATWRSRVQDRKDAVERAALAVLSYAGGLLRRAWVAWRYRCWYSRTARKAMAKLALRNQVGLPPLPFRSNYCK